MKIIAPTQKTALRRSLHVGAIKPLPISKTGSPHSYGIKEEELHPRSRARKRHRPGRPHLVRDSRDDQCPFCFFGFVTDLG